MYVTIGEKTSFGRTPAARREAALLQLLTEQVTSRADEFTQLTKIVRGRPLNDSFFRIIHENTQRKEFSIYVSTNL